MVSVFQPDLGTPAVPQQGRTVISPTATAIKGATSLLGGLAKEIRQEAVREDVTEVTQGVETVLSNLRKQSPLPEGAQRELERLANLGVQGREPEMAVRLSTLKGRLRAEGIEDDVIAFGFKQAGVSDPELTLTQLIIDEEKQNVETQRKLKESSVQNIILKNPSLAVTDDRGNIDVQATFDAAQRRELNVQRVANSFEQDIGKLTTSLTSTVMDTFYVSNLNLQRELAKDKPNQEQVSLIINDMVQLKGQADALMARAKLGRSAQDIKAIDDRIVAPLNSMFEGLIGAGDDITALKANATVNSVLADANRRIFRTVAPAISAFSDALGPQVVSRMLELNKSLFKATVDASEVAGEEYTNAMTLFSAPAQAKSTPEGSAPEVSTNIDIANISLDALRTITGDLSNIDLDVKVGTGPNGVEMSSFSMYASSVLGNRELRSQYDQKDMEQFFDLITSDGFKGAIDAQAKVSPALAELIQSNVAKVSVEIFAGVLRNAVNSGLIPPELAEEPVLEVNRTLGTIQINSAVLAKIPQERIVRLAEGEFLVRDFPGIAKSGLRQASSVLQQIGKLNTMLQNFKSVTGRSGSRLLDFIVTQIPSVETGASDDE